MKLFLIVLRVTQLDSRVIGRRDVEKKGMREIEGRGKGYVCLNVKVYRKGCEVEH